MVRLRPWVSALAALLLLSPVVLPLASGLAASPHADRRSVRMARVLLGD